MAYHKTRPGAAAAVAAANWFRPSYLRSVARATMNWQFAQSGAVQRVPLQSLVQGAQTLHLSLSAHVWGETSPEDLVALCTLVSGRQPKTIFEFGTFTGHATMNLAMNTDAAARIWTLDLPPGKRDSLDGLHWEKDINDALIGSSYRASPYAGRIQQLWADSREFDPMPYAEQMDFVFIDACHEYEFVVNDSEKAFQMLSPGGIIAWHDYSRACPGVCKYLDDLARTYPVFLVDGTQIAFCRSNQESSPCAT